MLIEIKNLNSKIQIETEGIVTKHVTGFGNGGKIGFFGKFVGRDVLVILPKKKYKIKVDDKCKPKIK